MPAWGQEESFAMGGLPDAYAAVTLLRALAAIEPTVAARQRLLPRRCGVQVPCQLHGVMQNPTNHNEGRFRAVNKKVSRSANNPHTWIDVVPAQSQVPRSNTCAEFGSRETARSVGLVCHVAERGNDKAFVPQAGVLAKLLMCPVEDTEDIALRGVRQPITKHQAGVLAGCAARRPSCPTKSSS